MKYIDDKTFPELIAENFFLHLFIQLFPQVLWDTLRKITAL